MSWSAVATRHRPLLPSWEDPRELGVKYGEKRELLRPPIQVCNRLGFGPIINRCPCTGLSMWCWISSPE